MNIHFDKEIRVAAPAYKMLLIEADVINVPTPDPLWQEIEDCSRAIAESTPIDRVRHRPAIDATRAAYKACGKDPNRYRPSAEALCRRAVKGLELYRTLAVIDLVNLLSMRTGHSIGAFDADLIVGNDLTLGVGAEGEPYEAIGRGELNIAGLPVWRDAIGGIGTPTSDNERTKLSEGTRRVLITLNIYGDDPDHDADALAAMTADLLSRYAGGANITTEHHSISDHENN